MLYQKMNDVIQDVCANLAEREELVHTIALALLTRKNLFVIGKPGQSKSQAIDLFRSHISDAKQFSISMNKEVDEEKLFGRLDLSSIIPGHVSVSRLKKDAEYQRMSEQMRKLLEDAEKDTGNGSFLQAAANLQEKMELRRKCLSELYGGHPEILTQDKIPEAHICFLDELFKAGDGVLNSLLTATNEKVYTNEGVTIQIPVISFFSASNEIPNFNHPEERSLQALYDRFDFKVNTRYVENKENRLKILEMKQQSGAPVRQMFITLSELYQMQDEVKKVSVPRNINELADNILCELRRKDIAVSDRIYFNYAPVVQAEAWLHGRETVLPDDLLALVNYLWNKPEERQIIEEVIRCLTENPLGNKLDELLAEVYRFRDEFEAASDKNRALFALRNSLVALYDELNELKQKLPEHDAAQSAISGFVSTVEAISREAHEKTKFTYIPMDELKAYQTLSA